MFASFFEIFQIFILGLIRVILQANAICLDIILAILQGFRIFSEERKKP